MYLIFHSTVLFRSTQPRSNSQDVLYSVFSSSLDPFTYWDCSVWSQSLHRSPCVTVDLDLGQEWVEMSVDHTWVHVFFLNFVLLNRMVHVCEVLTFVGTPPWGTVSSVVTNRVKFFWRLIRTVVLSTLVFTDPILCPKKTKTTKKQQQNISFFSNVSL